VHGVATAGPPLPTILKQNVHANPTNVPAITYVKTEPTTQQLAIDYKPQGDTPKAYNAQGTKIRIDPTPRNFHYPSAIPPQMDFNQIVKAAVAHLIPAVQQRQQQQYSRREGSNERFNNRSGSNERQGNNSDYRNTRRDNSGSRDRRNDQRRSDRSPSVERPSTPYYQEQRGRSPDRRQDSRPYQSPNSSQNTGNGRGYYQGGNTQSYASNRQGARPPFRPNREASSEKIRGKHVPMDFSPTNDKHCMKCGGKNVEGKTMYHTNHADDKCYLYTLWNPDPCIICQQAGFTAHHYETSCRRNVMRPQQGNL
jgi:hypothetical protein